MNVLVASLANNQRLAAARCHPLDPERFFALSRSVQISQLADVVDLKRSLLRLAQLAFLSQKTLHDLATKTTVHHLGLVFERGVLLPSQFDAPEYRYQWFLLLAPVDDDSQHLLGAVDGGDGPSVLPVNYPCPKGQGLLGSTTSTCLPECL
jgi:hypothetical protein